MKPKRIIIVYSTHVYSSNMMRSVSVDIAERMRITNIVIPQSIDVDPALLMYDLDNLPVAEFATLKDLLDKLCSEKP